MSSEKQQNAKPRVNRQAVTGLIVVIVIVVALALAYTAWKTAQPRPTPIGDILGDLRTWDGQLVTVRGEASNPINLLLFKGYDVSDDTGTIKVVTDRGLPKPGETITVQGQVKEVFNFNGMNMTVIYEPAEDSQP
jgi:hypothetical protein